MPAHNWGLAAGFKFVSETAFEKINLMSERCRYNDMLRQFAKESQYYFCSQKESPTAQQPPKLHGNIFHLVENYLTKIVVKLSYSISNDNKLFLSTPNLSEFLPLFVRGRQLKKVSLLRTFSTDLGQKVTDRPSILCLT